MPSTWTPVVFFFLLVPLLIVLLIVYLRSKQFYRLVYILSVFTYAMTIMYWIDSYRLGRNAIVGLLIASSLIMIFIGRRMQQQTQKKKKTKGPNVLSASIALGIMAIIVGLSTVPYGLTSHGKAVSSVALDSILPVVEEGKAPYRSSNVPLYTMSVTNTFIPRQFELAQASACLYNTEKNAYRYLDVMWDIPNQMSDFGPSNRVLEVDFGTKTATLTTSVYPQVRPVMEKPIQYELEVYDELYLIFNEGDRYEYVDCFSLTPQQKEQAVKIAVTS